ncbi:amino acid permease [Aeoliella sp. SH292]|uniref:amino acid permease n=1 Tax=Aeoliella sp. SH292 TaxID=3454464 RepID=UPI003F9BE545
MWRRQAFTSKPLQVLLDEASGEHRLHRVLGPWALSALGIGAIIGTGIFVLVGEAAHDYTGPSLMLSFVVAGTACIFAALCYAEFASMAPVAGSAYTYGYATMGELFAWIIGWDLVLEYAVSSAAVAHGWSKYFQNLLGMVDLQVPLAWRDAPFDYNLHTGEFHSTGSYFDLPAFLISLAVTVILVIGIRQSTWANGIMVIIKVAVVLFAILVGAFYINPDNWTPFAPYGYTGVSFFGHTVLGQESAGGKPVGMLAGAAIIFFAYIGFDAVSTHAEEAKKPERDVPIGIIVSLVVCTLLYIAMAAVITGMVPYNQLDKGAPVADAFEQIGMPGAQLLINIGAIAGMTSVMLVTMLSQPRVLLAMARDGLLPEKFFGAVHETFKTPWKSTIVTGFAVAGLSSLLPLSVLADLVNIGTLLAFAMVCLAVLIMRRTHPDAHRPFRVPFSPLLPMLGIGFCLLLMFSLPIENWLRLAGWLLVGFAIYFFYGRRHSKMGIALLREEAEHGLSPAGANIDPVQDDK